MFFELIATFAAGFGAAGLALLVNLITGGRLSRWAMPVAAGAAMIGITIANEYSWSERTIDRLPDGVEVVDQVQQSRWFRPWSYLKPQVVRLVTIDTASIRTRPELPALRLVDLYLFQRWQPPAQVPQLIDCELKQRAPVTDTVLGNPSDAYWSSASTVLLQHACKDSKQASAA